MRSREILVAICLFFSQPAIASEVTWEQLRDWLEYPQIAHKTTKGTVICRDPQIEFDEKQWLVDNGHKNGGSLLEHMLVDTLQNKKLLNKTEADLAALFPSGQGNGLKKDEMIYEVNRGSKCGNGRRLVVEVIFDNQQRVLKYRTVNFNDVGVIETQSDWIE